MPVLAYRYLEDDCLLYVYPGEVLLTDAEGKPKGSFGIAAKCGRREDTYLGAVESPSDILDGDEIPITGAMRPITALKRQAMAARER